MTAALFALTLALSAVSPTPDTLTVVSYNIHHGEGVDKKIDLERIAGVLEALQPDVVCLQEMDRNLSRTGRQDFPAWFAQRLKMNVAYGVNYRFDGGEYGVATLTRLPILAERTAALPTPKGKEPRGCLATTLDWRGQPVEVLNNHLGLDGKQREAQTEALLALVQKDQPTILAGDLNETVKGPALQALLKIFQDTLPPDAPATVREGRIDYILTTGGLETVSARVVDSPATRAGSDHLPVMAVIGKK